MNRTFEAIRIRQRPIIKILKRMIPEFSRWSFGFSPDVGTEYSHESCNSSYTNVLHPFVGGISCKASKEYPCNDCNLQSGSFCHYDNLCLFQLPPEYDCSLIMPSTIPILTFPS